MIRNIGAEEDFVDSNEIKEKKEDKEIKIYADAELLKSDIIRLCSIPSVSGFEYRASERVKEIYSDCFDEISTDAVGNQMLVRRCGKENAPKILIDAHFDEVGMLVSDALDGGFFRMVPIGGIDPAIMQAADVVVLGSVELRGVVVSTPPHLRAASNGKLPRVEELLVDVGLGYTRDELLELAPIGSPIAYAAAYSTLGEKYIAGKSFDDKACGAIAARAITDTPRDRLAGDVYLCFSAREETSAHGGALSATFKLAPDYAMVIDVNLGSAPDVPSNESVKMGGGISVSYSAATHRELTRMTVELYREKEISVIPTAEPSSTGTNAPVINLVREGIPVVDIGLPLRNMHTYNEVISLDDCNALCGAVREFICSERIADAYGKEELI